MANPTKNVVTFLTQNQKLCDSLQSSLPDFVVFKVGNLEEINNSMKHRAVGAVVVHMVNSAGWIIFDLLKTGYPDVPRFAILAPSMTGKEEGDLEALAKRHGAAAVIGEKGGIKSLAALIENQIYGTAKENGADGASSKESFLEIWGDLGRELERLQREFHAAGMRTLPQPVVAPDTKKRLDQALAKLQSVKIMP